MAKNTSKRVAHRKVYLTFPAKKTREAIICDMYDKYRVRFNIRSAAVDEKIGLIALELSGPAARVSEALAYFRKRGVKVEPIEMDVLAG